MYAAIMAGGMGTRLWPLSRQKRPKQFLSLQDDGRTLLQEAVRRAARVIGSRQRDMVVAQEHHRNFVLQQIPDLPEENLILEPVGRNTAACLGLAAAYIHRRSPGAVMAVFPADHLFRDEGPWIQAVQAAVAFAGQNDQLVTIGIPPEKPSSNYGYLHIGASLGTQNGFPIFEVRKFVEKPDMAEAEQYCASGDYLWNTGTFAWQVAVFQEALRQHLPQTYQALAVTGGQPEKLREIYPQLENISVDFGVMEKAAGVAVVKASFQRIDVGSLSSLADLFSKDPQGNAVLGHLESRDSRRNIVYSDQGMVGLIGVEDMIVVCAGDVVLVCPKDRADEIKELVAQLERQAGKRYR